MAYQALVQEDASRPYTFMTFMAFMAFTACMALKTSIAFMPFIVDNSVQ